MHYFLFLRLSGFYAKALLELDSRLVAKPVVVHRDKRVLDVNALAEARQIYRGMPLAEAKAILQEGSFLPWEEEPYREAQCQWLDVCTEFSDVIEPDEQHSAWIDLSLHPDPYLLARRLIERLSDSTGLRVLSGMGWSKWIARLAASHGASHAKAQRPQRRQEQSFDFLSELKTRFLTPVDPEHRSRLEFLGYMTIGEVARVPLNVLRSQFGDAATHIRMCARGGFFEPVEAKYPPNSISERVPFEGSVEDLQTLDLALRYLASALSRRLSKEDKQGKDLVVTLEVEGSTSHHEDTKSTQRSIPVSAVPYCLSTQRSREAEIQINDQGDQRPLERTAECAEGRRRATTYFYSRESAPGSTKPGVSNTKEHEGAGIIVRRRKFTKPIQNYASALASLRLMLMPPPEEPIFGIRARLENVTESKRIQQELTGRTTSADRERGAMAAFQHIRTVFGDAAIVAGGDIVEPRRKQVLRAWKDATGWS